MCICLWGKGFRDKYAMKKSASHCCGRDKAISHRAEWSLLMIWRLAIRYSSLAVGDVVSRRDSPRGCYEGSPIIRGDGCIDRYDCREVGPCGEYVPTRYGASLPAPGPAA